MPLRCVNTAGDPIHSFALDQAQWSELQARNRSNNHLRMPCCEELVVLKTSSLGTRFFAHHRRGDCTSKPESPEHLQLKSQVATAIAAAGWEVATEVRGQCPEGQLWIADVLASRGEHRLAVEIQWTRQSDAVTFERQARYKASGVRCLWLFRQPAIKHNEVPALTVAQQETGQFVVLIDNWQYERVETVTGPERVLLNTPKPVPIETCIKRIFSGRHLWFGIFRQGTEIELTVYGSGQDCHRCSGWTKLAHRMTLVDRRTNLTYEIEPFMLEFFRSLLDQINPELLRSLMIGPLENRSGNAGYADGVVNTCFHCGADQRYMASDADVRKTTMPQLTQSVIVTPLIQDRAQNKLVAKWRIDFDPEPGHSK